jgi:2-polyprenyl-6-methoxyphenol hydroxylase-like FAD-dependent oxidoreductase
MRSMSALDGRRVVVVGAGIGGTVAAILCARAGARVTLLDHSRRHDADTGMVLQPDALAVLHALGLRERLSRRGRCVTRRRIANARDRTLLGGAVRRGSHELDHTLVVRRSDLDAALADVAATERRIERRIGAVVRDVRSDGALTYSMPRGISSMRAELIVAADGMRSPVRTRGGMPAQVDGPWWYVRGIGPSLPRLAAVTEYWTPLGVFGVSPLDHGTSFYAATHAASAIGPIRERDLAAFRTAWTETLPVAAPMLTGVATFARLQIGRMARVDCPFWSDGRIVLLGDAAHAAAPSLTHGASSAVVDAYVLAAELTRCADQTEALRRYEERRRAAAAAERRRLARLVRLSTTTHPAVRVLREGMLQLTGRWMMGRVSLRERQAPRTSWAGALADPGRRHVMGSAS